MNIGLLVSLIAFKFITSAAFADQKTERKSEWNVEQGLSVIQEKAEFEAPVGIAFLKNPGNQPSDIRYFVTELRGRIIGVTNSGEKLVLKEVEDIFQPPGELPNSDGELGLGGICLSKDDKYLFTTGVIKSGFAIYNSVSRWEPAEAKLGWRNLKRTAYLKDIFLADKTVRSHNIGHCVVDEHNHLYFGTGDGRSAEKTHLLDSTHGKLYRTTLDFAGIPDNPFFKSSQPKAATSLFYALGFRNPWAVTISQGEVFIADNGPGVDRVVHVKKGKDYPWTGSDTSMTYDNLISFSPALGPAGVAYIPWNHPIKSLRGNLLVAASHRTEIAAIPLTPDFKIAGDWRMIVSPSDPKVRGDFAGVFLHGDDIYVSHIRLRQAPDEGIIPSTFLKIVPSTADTGPVVLTGEALMQAKDCRSCHVFIGRGGNQGPSLDELLPRLRERLGDGSYLKRLKDLQGNTDEPEHDRWKTVRAQFIDKKGSVEERMRLWIESKIEHTQFDSTTNVMPVLKFTKDEIKEMARYLMATAREPKSGVKWYKKLDQKLKAKPGPVIVVVLIIGVIVGFIIGRQRARQPRR